MTWQLWLDDLRNPITHKGIDFCSQNRVVWARDMEQALAICAALGEPSFMHLDHDLGFSMELERDHTSMDFVKEIAHIWDSPPPWNIHSANPVGSANLESFLNSWKKSTESED